MRGRTVALLLATHLVVALAGAGVGVVLASGSTADAGPGAESAETAGSAGGTATPSDRAATDDGQPATSDGRIEPASARDGEVGAQANPTGGQPACDFAALYDGTADSVVQIRLDAGLGSGFVVRTDRGNDTSYVVTNEHVVGDAERVTVAFGDGDLREGVVVGTDDLSDLAVVRVADAPADAEPLPLLERQPEPGEQVAALGSPFGLAGTITEGIVSGVNRTMPTETGFLIPDAVQTDAAINPGNSGGPLVGCGGRVVGVNRAGGGENLGFAISADLVARVVPALVAEGEYRHAYLGVGTAPVTPAIAAANDLNATRGVYVDAVVEDGPAGGVLRGTTDGTAVGGTTAPTGGDVIVAVDGRPVGQGEELASYLATETRPGDTVSLTVVRDGERRTVDVTLGTRPELPRTGPTESGSDTATAVARAA